MSVQLKVKNSGVLEIQKFRDERDGCLCILEVGRHIDWDIKRVYFINHLEGGVSVRGKHAHKELEQYIFCLQGSFMLDLDDGENKQSVNMWQDNIGIRLGPMLWHEMHSFSSGCVIMVVASEPYDESDYIRNYEEFKDLASK